MPQWASWITGGVAALFSLGSVITFGFNILIDPLQDDLEDAEKELVRLEELCATAQATADASLLRWRDYDTLWKNDVAERRRTLREDR